MVDTATIPVIQATRKYRISQQPATRTMRSASLLQRVKNKERKRHGEARKTQMVMDELRPVVSDMYRRMYVDAKKSLGVDATIKPEDDYDKFVRRYTKRFPQHSIHDMRAYLKKHTKYARYLPYVEHVCDLPNHKRLYESLCANPHRVGTRMDASDIDIDHDKLSRVVQTAIRAFMNYSQIKQSRDRGSISMMETEAPDLPSKGRRQQEAHVVLEKARSSRATK